MIALYIAVTLSCLGAVTTLAKYESSNITLLHPRVFPTLYITFVMAGPPIYLQITSKALGPLTNDILTPTAVTIAATFIIALNLTLMITGRSERETSWKWGYRNFPEHAHQTPSADISENGPKDILIRFYGRCILFGGLLLKLGMVAIAGPVSEQTYGANQLDYGLVSVFATVSEGTLAIGTILVMYANVRLRGRIMSKLDAIIILGTITVSMLLLGSRGEVIAIFILGVWYILESGRKVRLVAFACLLITISVLYIYISAYRTNSTASVDLVTAVLTDVSSPTYINSRVSALVPSEVPYFNGSTYLASIRLLLPGFIVRIFGEVSGTGALEFRDLIGWTSTNHGWSFSIPSEAYMNLGIGGVAVIGIFLGLLLKMSFGSRFIKQDRFRLSVVVYPLLLSYIPYGLRSDALGNLKSIIYPLIIGAVVFYLAKPNSQADRARTSIETRRRW